MINKTHLGGNYNKMSEIWKDVKNYEDLYQVSNLGQVKSKKSGRILKTPPIKTGYLRLNLLKNGKPKQAYVHRIVAEVFIPQKIGKSEINHIDGDKTNNRIENLEWVTHKENILHSHRIGLNKPNQVKGSKVVNAILTEEQAQIIIDSRGLCSAKQLSEKFNTSVGNIYYIWQGLSWKHLKRKKKIL